MESNSVNATPQGSSNGLQRMQTSQGYLQGSSNGLQRMQTSQGRTSGPTRRSTKGQWTTEEDEVLRRAVERFNGKNWKKIAECCKDRTDVQCLHRWQKVLNPELVKGPWTKEEDDTMVELVKKYGAKKWSTIAQNLPGRIGKQCRERWHNHLNPEIKREAWTQEEELILIHAHQEHGNKWAELTKYLPGRSDNSIKNHWNSSVRKKLDSYLASGLLAQFQGLPRIGETSQAAPSPSSIAPQSSGDESVPNDVGAENEEISVCSQGLSALGVRCSNGISSAVRDNHQLTRASTLGIVSTPNLEDVDVFFGAEVPFEIGGSSDILDRSYPNDVDMDLGEDFFMPFIGVPETHEPVPFPLQNSVGSTAPSMDRPEDMISEDECYRLIFSDAEIDRNYVSGNPTEHSAIDDFIGSSSSFLQLLDSENPQPSGRPEMLGVTVPHESAPSRGIEFNGCNNIIYQRGEMELESYPDNGITFINNSLQSPSRVHDHNVGAEDELDNGNERLNLVAVDLSNLGPSSSQQSFATTHDPGHANNSLRLESDEVSPINTEACPREDISITVPSDGNDTGSLCYEPPRFPSLDIPFFSCDLAQPGDHMQQEYSPLGIRQLMMQSQGCFSPVRSWDSPKHDDNAKAVVKSAAKTFLGTPSILKKRNRDCLSPMPEKSSEKKLELGMDRLLFLNLAKDFSRQEVTFSEKENQMLELSQDKENTNPVSNIKANSQKVNQKNSDDEAKPGNAAAYVQTEGVSDAMTENVSRPPGVLFEHAMNDMLFFSPERSENISDNIAHGNHCTENFDSTFKQGSLQESSLDPWFSAVSPMVSKTNDKFQLGGAMSGKSPLALELPEVMAQSNGGSENLSMFGETPVQRSFESPSAWKSPWFMNSFTPGPKVDTDIRIEDIGYVTPGDRSIDAIGLMKELSEHNAPALAEVRKFLGDETPEDFFKYRRSTDPKQGQGNSVPKCQTSAQSRLEPSLLKEKRVLDFSDCGTPGKSKQKSKTSTSMSSPSSYLLKGCR